MKRRPITRSYQLAKAKHIKQAVFMKLIKMFIVSLICLVATHVNAEERIFVGDVKPMKAKVGYGSYGVITNGISWVRNGGSTGAFMADGKPAQKGLITCCDSEVVFAIPSGVRRFVSIGTMPDYKTPSKNGRNKESDGLDHIDGVWSYEVLIDGIQVYESEPLCSYVKKEIPIEVDIPEKAQYLTLKTHQLGNGNCDHCIWAEPYFIKP